MLKLACSKWHFGQVGQGGKNTTLGVFFIIIFGQKCHHFLQCKFEAHVSIYENIVLSYYSKSKT
jgi:hypothetical protein